MSRAAEIEVVIAPTAVQSILSAPLGDGCLRTTIVARERAGTHHRAPRVRRAWPAVGSMTREAWHRSTNSPARHVISNLLVSITRTRSPVGNVFSLIAVRELLWKGASVAGPAIGPHAAAQRMPRANARNRRVQAPRQRARVQNFARRQRHRSLRA